MNEFKVGDWVEFDNSVFCVHKEYNGNRYISEEVANNLTNYGKSVTLWQPEIGEWCWFWEIDSNPKLCQYSKYINGEYEALSIDPYYELEGHFGFCEPFIGELPSFIKERSCNQLT